MYEKLLNVQRELGAIQKDSTNPYFKSKYFDINALLAHVKPVLNKHGLVIIQALTNINGKSALDTQIIDSENGKMFRPEPVILPECADAQKFGSAITYFRRYAIQTLLALEAEDDDANVATNKITKKVEDDSVPF